MKIVKKVLSLNLILDIFTPPNWVLASPVQKLRQKSELFKKKFFC